MTKAQYKVFNRLARRQVNRTDIRVVETAESFATFFLAFPGLYLTYDRQGSLIKQQTITERVIAKDHLAGPPDETPLLGIEMGTDNYQHKKPMYQDNDPDDDVPF